jgi:hypothetical protein
MTGVATAGPALGTIAAIAINLPPFPATGDLFHCPFVVHRM